MLRNVSISKCDASLVCSPESYLKLVFDTLKVRKAIVVLLGLVFFFFSSLEPYSAGLLGSEGSFSPCQ